MSYYLAVKNKETGRFELSWREGEPHQYPYLRQALAQYALATKLYGTESVRLVEWIPVDIKVEATVMRPIPSVMPESTMEETVKV